MNLDLDAASNAMFNWTQGWIHNFNKQPKQQSESEAPTFVIESTNSPRERNRGGGWVGRSILRNGKKKRSVSWSRTIQVETFESRDEIPEVLKDHHDERDETPDEFPASLDYHHDERDLNHCPSYSSEESEESNMSSNKNNLNTSMETFPSQLLSADSDEDVFAKIDENDTRTDEMFYSVLSVSSTISSAAIEKHTGKVKASDLFVPVIIPDNFRLENRLERTDSGTFATLSEDDRSLIENLDDTPSLVLRRGASDDESINPRFVLSSFTSLWVSLGLKEVMLKKAASDEPIMYRSPQAVPPPQMQQQQQQRSYDHIRHSFDSSGVSEVGNVDKSRDRYVGIEDESSEMVSSAVSSAVSSTDSNIATLQREPKEILDDEGKTFPLKNTKKEKKSLRSRLKDGRFINGIKTIFKKKNGKKSQKQQENLWLV